MSVAYYHSSTLPWSSSEQEKNLLRKIWRNVLIAFLVFSIVIPMIHVPERERSKRDSMPPRLAKLITERKKLPPPPPKVEEKKAEKPKEEKKKEPEKKKEVDKVAQARKKAAKSGLLAMSSELASLRDAPTIPKHTLAKISAKSATAQQTERSIISNDAAKGSGGLNVANMSRDTGGQDLSARQVTKVDAPELKKIEARKKTGGRSDADIHLVFEQNKMALESLYNRARRKNPFLQGVVVVEVTISAEGRVEEVKIVSSELNDEELERKLKARISLFNFGPDGKGTITVTRPLNFSPPA